MSENMVQIHAGSAAFAELKEAVEYEDVYKISLWIDDGELKIKVNEGLWSPPLAATQ